MARSATSAASEGWLTAINAHHTKGHSNSYAPVRMWRIRRDGELSMLDILMVVIALAFFALTVGYAYACDRL
jgi:hypothetical protein